MRPVDNAIADVIEELRLRNQVDHSVTYQGGEEERWIIRLISKPGALVLVVLEVEVLYDEDGDWCVCVLHSVGTSRRTLERIMDLLEERLEVPRFGLPLQPSPLGGEPARM